MLVWRERFRLDVWRWPDDCLSGLVSCRSSMHELLSEFSLKLPSRMSRILFLPSWRRQSASSSPMFTNSPTLFSLISPLRIQFRWSKKNHRCACQNIFANEFPHDKTTRACSSHFFISSMPDTRASPFLSGLVVCDSLRKIESDNWEITFSYSIIVNTGSVELPVFTLGLVKWLSG